MKPAVVIRPIWLALYSVNQRLPSGLGDPTTHFQTMNSVVTPEGVSTDLVEIAGEPKIAIRARRDALGSAVGRRDRKLRDCLRGQPPRQDEATEGGGEPGSTVH